MDTRDVEKPRVVSLYASRFLGLIVFEGGKDSVVDGEYVRVSEPITVAFKPLSQGDVVAAQVSAIDTEITKARDEFDRKLTDLQHRRQNLLALTAPSVGEQS